MIKWPESQYWNNEVKILSKVLTFDIRNISSLDNPKDSSLLFVKLMTPENGNKLSGLKGSLIITSPTEDATIDALCENNGIIFDDYPRYCFASLLQPFWDTKNIRGNLVWNSAYSAFIGNNVIIEDGVIIEPYVTISENSLIGSNSYIMSGARIGPNVIIGKNSIVRENCVIGGWGFGIAQKKGMPDIRIPHIGGVCIGDGVEVGALTTICSGTIDPTVIGDDVKIDDHVHIAHNCNIGKNSIVTASAEISGSVSVGENGWIAPNVSIINGITIGRNVTLGIGSVIIKDVDDCSVIVGNPGRVIRQNAI